MKTSIALLLGCLATIPSLSARAAQVAGTIEVDRVEESTIHFKASEGASAPSPLKTELHDLKYLGALQPPADGSVPPYFLFLAKPCKGCQQEAGIYAVRASGGKPFGFVHPGKIFDHKTRALLMESRGFYGRCLPGMRGGVYVAFQKERVDRRRSLQNSVLIAEPGPDHIHERLLERRLPRIKETLALVKAKACAEIDGRNRIMAARPLDVNLRRKATEDAEKDESDKNDEREAPATEAPDA